MPRKDLRFRIDDTGCLEVVDPGFDCLDLLQSIDPTFRVRQQKLPGPGIPRFQKTRKTGCGIRPSDFINMDTKSLWDIHGNLTSRENVPTAEDGQASLLDLKIELARRLIQECQLCNRNCGVDRTKGERGRCGLATGAIAAEHFVHIAEEPVINPSFVLNLAGCGLGCCFCQQSALLNPQHAFGEPLTDKLWQGLSFKGARTLSFAGGNPDESIYDILRFIKSAPKNLSLPIVWNNNAYGSLATIELLNGIVDVYLPDFKFSNEACGQKLAFAHNYAAAAKASVMAMVNQNVLVIVRILVLPGHFECCHVPTLDYLKQFDTKKLWVSIRGQYCPDWKINPTDEELARRPTRQEIGAVVNYAKDIGLIVIE